MRCSVTAATHGVPAWQVCNFPDPWRDFTAHPSKYELSRVGFRDYGPEYQPTLYFVVESALLVPGEDVSECQGSVSRRLLQSGVTVATPATWSYDILHGDTAVDGEIIGAGGGMALSRDWPAEVLACCGCAVDSLNASMVASPAVCSTCARMAPPRSLPPQCFPCAQGADCATIRVTLEGHTLTDPAAVFPDAFTSEHTVCWFRHNGQATANVTLGRCLDEDGTREYACASRHAGWLGTACGVLMC